MNGGELPPDLPSADVGWSNMKEKLETQMPVQADAPAGSKKVTRKSSRKRYGLLLLLILLIPVLWYAMSPGNRSETDSNDAAKIALEKTGSEKNGSKSTNTGADSKESSSHSGENKDETGRRVDAGDGNNDTSKEEYKDESSVAHLPGASKKKQAAGALTASVNRSSSPVTRNNTPGRSKPQRRGNKGKDGQSPKSGGGSKEVMEPRTGEESGINNDHNSIASTNTTSDDSLSTAAVIDTASKASSKTDSIAKAAPAAEPPPVEDISFTGGLYWSVQMPTYSRSNYFAGPDGRAQMYRILLPGIFVRVQSNKSAFVLDFNPFYTNLVPQSNFLTTKNTTVILDTTVITTENKSLRKTFGVASSISYEHNIRNQWWVGGGLQWFILNKGLAKMDVEEERVASNGGKLTSSYTRNYTIPQSEWAYFEKSYLGINGSIFYAGRRFQSGIRLTFPMAPLAKKDGPEYPLRSEFIFRYGIYQVKKKPLPHP
jgi:cbb3-type cytochrome oxidase subunit 3